MLLSSFLSTGIVLTLERQVNSALHLMDYQTLINYTIFLKPLNYFDVM